MVKLGETPKILHRYSYSDSKSGRKVLVEIKSLFPHNSDTYDWIVWIKRDNSDKYTDERYELSDMPDDWLTLFVAVRRQVEGQNRNLEVTSG